MEINYLSSGIYLLIDNPFVVYVGQSITPLSRIGQHLKEGKKKFTNVKVIPCSKDKNDLIRLESMMISVLKPIYNKTGYAGDPRKVPIDEVDIDGFLEKKEDLDKERELNSKYEEYKGTSVSGLLTFFGQQTTGFSGSSSSGVITSTGAGLQLAPDSGVGIGFSAPINSSTTGQWGPNNWINDD